MHRNIGTGEIKIALVEDNNALGSKSIGQKVDKDVLDDQNHLKCSRSICKTNEDQQESSGPKKDVNPNVYSQKDEPLSNISDSASVSFPATASTTTASRAPFALKDSFYNSECLEFSKESAVQLVEKIAIPLPTSEQKENS
ncbi:endochitinase A [Abeliophyllum distichum]|uniref:Endochitinase A n=1 Tax=Abeliophyllum distichum TaxID=126358 RepID=A0ABD1R117_9LAMI